MAFNYGGRAEIVDAARTFTSGTEEDFRAHLYAPDMHDPDLIIRTSGEQRISNYLLWQGAYSEWVFRDELWPDFSRESLEQSLEEFAARSRRSEAGSDAAGAHRARPRDSAARRARSRPKKPRRRSDLFTRMLVAVPLAIATIIFNNLGGLPFALFMIAAGLICMHELYGLLTIWRPVAAGRVSPRSS